MRVLDAGCGAGYGAHLLARSGALSVVAVDLDPRFVRYSKRHFSHPRVDFRIADCGSLALEKESVDVIVSSNMIEHLEQPAAFLASSRNGLVRSGVLLIAAPWIVDEATLEWNRRNPWHKTNLRVDEWMQLFRREGWAVRLWIQTFDPAVGVPDFLDPRPSNRPIEEFVFREVTVEEALNTWSLGVVFHLIAEESFQR